jgi:hypothetical protein
MVEWDLQRLSRGLNRSCSRGGDGDRALGKEGFKALSESAALGIVSGGGHFDAFFAVR